jgi:deoxyribose-phosphate aldolase
MLRTAGKAALDAGADFLKTSTGMAGGATPEMVAVLLDAIRHHGSGGIKVSGGVRTAEQAKDYLDQVLDVLGPVGSDRFRIGASSLLDELIR